MKTRFALIWLALLIAGIFASFSCKKEADVKKISDFTVSKHLPNETIAKGETLEIGLKINRATGYTGKFYILYEQFQNNGFGTVTYNGSILSQKVKKELNSDDVKLRYTAITANYHQLNFTIVNDANKQVEISIILNEELRGNDDGMFSATLPILPQKINKGETLNMNVNFKPGHSYTGKYFIQYSQMEHYGKGELKLNGSVMEKGTPYEITGEIGLAYTARSSYYHQLDLMVYDEQNRKTDLQVAFNNEYKDQVFEGFEVSYYSYNANPPAKTGVPVDFQLNRLNKDYTGKYYYRWYSVSASTGFALFAGQSAHGTHLTQNKNYELPLNSQDTFSFCFYLNDKAYHEIKMIFFDDEGHVYEHTFKFNEH